MSYSKINEVIDMPNLIEIQKNSYQWFLDEGLMEVLRDVSPITDYSGDIELSFIDKEFDVTNPTYSIEECKERDANFAAPLRVKVRLHNRKDDIIKDQYIYIGEFPIMSDNGTFIINGAERVIISQLVRSPGAYFDLSLDKTDKELYSSQIIPNRGAWLEYETDSNDLIWVRVDRTRKFHLTILLRSLGFGTNQQIVDAFGEENSLMQTMLKDGCQNREEGLQELYKKLRPGEPVSVEGAETLLNNMFFDPKRYDLARVGIYKINKKLSLATRLAGHRAAANVVDDNGELLVAENEIITKDLAFQIQEAGINDVLVYPMQLIGNTIHQMENRLKIVGNNRVDAALYIRRFFTEEELGDFDPVAAGLTEKARTGVLKGLILEAKASENPIVELKKQISAHINDLMPKHLTIDDIIASVSYLIGLEYGIGDKDDIDHLGNRRIRSVGELLQNQVRVGFSRMERVVRERMGTLSDIATATPQMIVNTRPVSAAIKEF
ncbi:MAG: DNA-directed RNA polymerase subunit beta, partial [Eubacteriales bacterium]|nr:DNA-directed RNA polymerase subunit beta [Eubacteriales bacterium]